MVDFLIQAKEYVKEQENSSNISLNGQESNGTTWAICKMNMILHWVTNQDIQNDDTLEQPLHKDWWEIKHFDKILANPPFLKTTKKPILNTKKDFKWWCQKNQKLILCFFNIWFQV